MSTATDVGTDEVASDGTAHDAGYQHLAEPFSIGSVRIKNRFTMAPVTLTSLLGPFGEFSPAGIEFYERRARGGFGLIMSGALMADMEVDPFSPTDGSSPLGAPQTFMRSAGELIERTGAYGAAFFPQISMGPGRNLPGHYAPSAVPSYADPSTNAPELTTDQIKEKIDAVVRTVAFMQKCGFPGVEIHAMHWGYLLDQFAMSLTNHRTDEYGGSLDNRLRAARQIVQGIKQVCGNGFAVSMRLGLKSYVKGFHRPSLDGSEEAGRTLEEGLRIAQLLESYGYDALNVDVGIYDSFYQAEPPIYMPRGHVIPMAARARQSVDIPVLCGSRMGDPDMCERALADGSIDAVSLGRPALADPDLPRKVLEGRREQIRPCIACNAGCIGELFAGRAGTCAVNPACGREIDFGLSPATTSRRVVVVGGGVAGMEAARVAALRGHRVSLHEASGQLGGVVIPGGAHPFKPEMHELIDYYRGELDRAGVDVHLNTEATSQSLLAERPDAVILAVGSMPVRLPVPGIEKAGAVTAIDALMHPEHLGHRVVVVGGGYVGCELALGAAEDGHEVTVVEALPDILSAGAPLPIMNSMMLRDLLAHDNVTTLTGRKVVSASAEGVSLEGPDGPEDLAADTIVVSIGYRPRPSMATDLAGRGIEVHEVGDGRHVGTVSTSVTDAYTVARRI